MGQRARAIEKEKENERDLQRKGQTEGKRKSVIEKKRGSGRQKKSEIVSFHPR